MLTQTAPTELNDTEKRYEAKITKISRAFTSKYETRDRLQYVTWLVKGNPKPFSQIFTVAEAKMFEVGMLVVVIPPSNGLKWQLLPSGGRSAKEAAAEALAQQLNKAKTLEIKGRDDAKNGRRPQRSDYTYLYGYCDELKKMPKDGDGAIIWGKPTAWQAPQDPSLSNRYLF